MNNTKIRISILLNAIIASLTLIACIFMFTGFKFMYGLEPVLEMSGGSMFRFFTVDSNIFMGITSLIFIFIEFKYLNGSIKEIPKIMYILKLMATSAVALTFFIVVAYLGQIAVYGFFSMFQNCNLFLHFIIPVLSIITFILFERTNKLTFKYSFYGALPTVLYAVYYLINIVLHIEDGKVSPLYDWYWFLQKGVWTAFIVGPLLLVISYLIGLVIWKFNRIKTH